MFKSSSLDPRIESVMPILSKLSKNVTEDIQMTEVAELEEWADNLMTLEDTSKEEDEDEKIGGLYDPDEFDAMVTRVGQKAKEQEKKNPVDLEKLAKRINSEPVSENSNLDRIRKLSGL